MTLTRRIDLPLGIRKGGKVEIKVGEKVEDGDLKTLVQITCPSGVPKKTEFLLGYRLAAVGRLTT